MTKTSSMVTTRGSLVSLFHGIFSTSLPVEREGGGGRIEREEKRENDKGD